MSTVIITGVGDITSELIQDKIDVYLRRNRIVGNSLTRITTLRLAVHPNDLPLYRTALNAIAAQYPEYKIDVVGHILQNVNELDGAVAIVAFFPESNMEYTAICDAAFARRISVLIVKVREVYNVA